MSKARLCPQRADGPEWESDTSTPHGTHLHCFGALYTLAASVAIMILFFLEEERERGRETEGGRKFGEREREQEEFWLHSYADHYFQPPPKDLTDEILRGSSLALALRPRLLFPMPPLMLTPRPPTAT